MRTKIILFDDYNQNIPLNQGLCGTITTQYGDSALRHGYKIIIIIEDEQE